MASITIRNLDDALKATLRVRAARHGRSMEDEVRNILRDALTPEPVSELNLVERIRTRFAAIGDVEIAQPPRAGIRVPPDFSGTGE